MIEQALLRAHHIPDGDHRERQRPGLPGRGIDVLGARRPHAPSEHIRADQEITLGIEHPARCGQRLPPPRLPGYRMRVGRVLVSAQRVADHDGVGPIRVELAVGLIGDRERTKIDPAIQPQGLPHKQTVTGPVLVRTRAGARESHGRHGMSLSQCGCATAGRSWRRRFPIGGAS